MCNLSLVNFAFSTRRSAPRTGGSTLKDLEGIEKKKSKKKNKALAAAVEGDAAADPNAAPADPTKPKPAAPTAINVMSGKTYEEEFDLETKRVAVSHFPPECLPAGACLAARTLHTHPRGASVPLTGP